MTLHLSFIQNQKQRSFLSPEIVNIFVCLRDWIKLKKAKASYSYIARLTGTKPDQPRFTIIGSGS